MYTVRLFYVASLCFSICQKLGDVKVPASRFASATLPNNKYKNRLVNILPCEFVTTFVCHVVAVCRLSALEHCYCSPLVRKLRALHIRCSDNTEVTELSIRPRRHDGGILNVNKREIESGNLKILLTLDRAHCFNRRNYTHTHRVLK